MTNNPQNPNFIPSVGRLVTDRYDFQSHVDGTEFRHNATQADLSPPITIGGDTYTTTQSAITALADIISPYAVPQATIGTTLNNLGIVTLGGDFAGTNSTALSPKVGGLQGYPVSIVTAPAVGQVLAWSGSAWTPSATTGFTAGGDLTGTSSLQYVSNLTGSAGTVTASANRLQFISPSTATTITQIYASGANAKNMTVEPQGVSSGTGAGGTLVLAGGKNSGAGLPGGVSLTIGGTSAESGSYVMQLAQVVSGQNVAAFFPSPSIGLTSTDMPSNSGNDVIYIGNTVGTPTVPSPTGSILYSYGGTLNIMQSNGTSFQIQPSISAGNNRAYYGDGEGGALVFDGSVVLGITPTFDGLHYIYALNKNVAASSLSVASNVIIETDGYAVFVDGTLTNNGIIDDSGYDASLSVAGAGALARVYGGGSAGGKGDTTGVNGQDGYSFSAVSNIGAAGLGGAGGGGGDANKTGGSSGSLAAHNITLYNLSSATMLQGAVITPVSISSVAIVSIWGGTGGGGGGAGIFPTFSAPTPLRGGGGGGGGGYMLITCLALAGSGIFQANGGIGADGYGIDGNLFGGAQGSGGGGGGGGGAIVIIYGDKSSWAGTATVNGGPGGAAGTCTPGTSGDPGTDGAVGTIVWLQG